MDKDKCPMCGSGAIDCGEWDDLEILACAFECDTQIGRNGNLSVGVPCWHNQLAAVKAERDELREDYAQQVDNVMEFAGRADELAARLRAVRSAWDMREFDTRHQVAVMDWGLVKAMSVALAGPIPECEGCREKVRDINKVLEVAATAGYVLRGLCEHLLARHAEQEGGDDE